MNHYELSIELIKIREQFHQQHYDDETTRNYFYGSVKQIHNYFMNSDWRKNYLFCSMGYFDNNKSNLIQYQYNEDVGCMSTYAISLMESLTQNWINEEESLSMTEMFLHEDNHDEHYKALFYKLNGSELKEKLNEFIYLNLKELKWDYKGSINEFRKTDFAKFEFGKIPHKEFNKHGGSRKNPFLNLIENPIEKDISEFNRLISIYLEIISTIEDECFFYFFKPHTFQNEFNGILLLGLKREMTPDEIEQWIDKAQRITVEIETKKMILTNRLISEDERISRSHILKTQIMATLLKPIKELSAEFSHPKLDKVEENINKLYTLLDLQSLVDKVENKNKFTYDAKMKNLFTEEIKTVNFDSVLKVFNEGIRSNLSITIKGETKILTNELFKIHGLYPEVQIVENFLYTVFENVQSHGSENGSNLKELEIIRDDQNNGWIFKNRVAEKLEDDIKKFTGSISEFNLLLTRPNCGKIIMEFSDEADVSFFNLKIINLNNGN